MTRRIAREDGSILILTAVSIVVLLGIAGLSLDTSYFYDVRHRIGAAADAGARSGALELKRGVTDDDVLTAFAQRDAAVNGFTHGVDGVTVTVNHPPQLAGSAHFGDDKYVEVVVEKIVPTFFMKLYNRNSMKVSARAVAGFDAGGVTNIIVLSEDCGKTMDIGGTVTVAGSIQVNAGSDPSCVGPTNGISVSTSGYVSSPDIDVVGDQIGGNECARLSDDGQLRCRPSVNYNQPVISDPFAWRTPPSCPGCPVFNTDPDCNAAGCFGTASKVLHPGIYNAGITINELGAGGVVTFEGGTYILNNSMDLGPGDGKVTSCGVTGSVAGCGSTAGVTFYYNNPTSGNMRFSDGTIELRAPTSATDGDNEAMLLWQNPTNTNRLVVDSATTVDFTGVIYIPNALIDFTSTGSTSAAPYTIFVSKTLSIGTSGTFNSNVSSLSSGSPTSANGNVSIAE